MYGDIPAEGITINVPNPPKTARVRLPTSQEMLDRLAPAEVDPAHHWPAKSQTQFVPNPKADLDLFNQIRLDKDGVEFDDSRPATPSRSSHSARSPTASVLATSTVSRSRRRLGTPSTRCASRRRGIHPVPAHGHLRDRSPARPGGDSLPHGTGHRSVRLCGRQGRRLQRRLKMTDVPPHHKSAVVVELVQAIDDLDPQIDPNS